MRGAALWLLAFVVAAPRATAQAPSELRLEAGYARVRQPNDAQSDAGVLAFFWRRPLETWTFLASGNITYGTDSIAAAQAVAALSIPWGNDDRFRTEGGLAGARFSLGASGRGGNVNGYARQHFVTDKGGAWAGGGAARTARDGEQSLSFGSDAGIWGRLGFLYGSASVAWQRSNDFPLILLLDDPSPDPNQRHFNLTDVEVVFEARGGPNSLGVSWASRRLPEIPGAEVVAISTSGILQITERVAVTASAGRQLADPLRGLPQAELLTSSLRVSIGRKPLPVMPRSEIARAIVEPAPGGGGELVVQVFASDTMLVEVAGDFSGWNPIPLVRESGVLVGRVRLAPGKYHVAVRVNLGEWRSPRNLARVPDEYGGEAGIVIVP
jgi:hypothetical protein